MYTEKKITSIKTQNKEIKMIKVIKKNSTHNSAIHPRPKEVMVFLHYKDKKEKRKDLVFGHLVCIISCVNVVC